MNLLKIARILDANGNYLLADKLDKYAQQGVMNLDRIFKGAEQEITSWLRDMTTLLPSGPGELDGGYFEFENVEIFNKMRHLDSHKTILLLRIRR